MKIAIISDLHLNKTVYKGVMDREYPNLPFRNADFMRAFKWMTSKCIEDIKPDLLVIPGDIYEYYEPTNEIRGFFSEQISRFLENKIPCLILIGNHDICRKHHALKDIQELNMKSVKVIDNPQILEYKDHRFLLFPYSLEIEQGKKTIKELFGEFLKEVKEKPSDKTSIFFGHFGVKNAIMNEYGKEEEESSSESSETTSTVTRKPYYNRRQDDLDISDLDNIGADYIFLGDFHRAQRLKTKTWAFYTGSIERTDLTELDQKKGFMVYDSEAVENSEWGKCQFIEYPYCRPMTEIKGTFSDIKAKFDSLDFSKYQGAIIKIKFIGTQEELLDFSSGLDEFKKYVSEKIDPIHFFSINYVKNTEEQEKASELEKEILERGGFASKDVINVVKEMVNEKVMDSKEQKEIAKIVDDIYDELMREI